MVKTMDTIAQIISGLIGVAIVLMIAPRVLAANQGKILQNIAIWVGIFLILALIYKTYGPGKLEGVQDEGPTTALSRPDANTADDKGDKPDQPDNQPALNEDQGFMPPREE